LLVVFGRLESFEALFVVLVEVVVLLGQEGQLSVADFSRAWLRDYGSVRLRPTGYREYESILRLHVIPALGSRQLAEITTQDLQAYLAGRVRGGLSPRTVTNHLALLRSMFRTAVSWDLVARNPAEEAAPPRKARPERTFLTPDQMRGLIAATPTAWRLLIALPCLTGARKGECLAISFAAVSLADRTIRFERSIRGGVIHEVKTPGSRATVPLPESLVRLFEARRRVAPDANGLVFCRTDGSPLSDSKPNAVLSTALSKAGLPHVSFHDLRRSWVVAHIVAGTPVKTIVTLGRWQNAQTMLDEYAALLPTMGGDAAATVDRLIGGSGA
jgi:integrase